jgi:AraC family transcriptional regulator
MPHQPSPAPAIKPLAAAAGGYRIELLPRARYQVRYTPGTGVTGFAFETQAGVHSFASSRERPFRTRPNSLAYIPAGCDTVSRSDAGGEYLTVQNTGKAGVTGERCFNDHFDPAALAAAERLRRMMLAREADPLLLETQAAELCEAATGVFIAAPAAAPGTGWMTARRLRLADELIESKLDGPLTVSEIAACLGLSPGFFTRAFKAATGQTPHSYIIARRLSRARVLLRTGAMDLAGIAAACGFASHAHMTAQFRGRLGVTPRELRESGPPRRAMA